MQASKVSKRTGAHFLDVVYNHRLFRKKIFIHRVGLIVESVQKGNQPFSICGQCMINILWHLGVRNEQLKYVERVELYLVTVISKQIHPNFQV